MRAPKRCARRAAKRSACAAGSLKSVGTRISFGGIELMKHLQSCRSIYAVLAGRELIAATAWSDRSHEAGAAGDAGKRSSGRSYTRSSPAFPARPFEEQAAG